MNYKRKEIIGDATLYLGDCLEILPDLDPVDAVVADPPYGIGLKSNGLRFKNARPIEGDQNNEMIDRLISWCAPEMPFAMFFSPYNFIPYPWRSVLIWDKGEHVGGGGDPKKCWKRDYECIGVANNPALKKRDSSVLRIPGLLKPLSGHPAEKPISIIAYFVERLTLPGGVVLDPFMGSGTTGVACMELGRKFIGIEINEKYFDIACRRIDPAERQGKLFNSENEGNLKYETDNPTLF